MGVEWRKSGQIPAFGDWDNADDMPITQYFECARQAGLVRCSCSGEICNSYPTVADLYAVDFQKPSIMAVYAPPPRKARGMNKRYPPVKEQRRQVKACDVLEQPRNQPLPQKKLSDRNRSSTDGMAQQTKSTVKPVDEDLYKIPSELLPNSKRKKMLGFFSRCIVPPCKA